MKFDPFIVGVDVHQEGVEATEPEKTEGQGPRVAEVDGGSPCVALLALPQLELDTRGPAGRMKAAHDDLILGGVAEVDARELGDMVAHANVAGAGVEQAGLWRQLESFDDEVDDGAWTAGVTGEGLKGVSHQGAAPLACSSSLGTRNILSAR